MRFFVIGLVLVLVNLCFGLQADLNKDGYVNFQDFVILAQEWLMSDPNLVAHYKMDDNADSTTVVDTIGFSHGTAQRNTSLMHVDGKVGGALEFNYLNDVVNIGNDLQYVFKDSFTVSMWCKIYDGVRLTNKRIQPFSTNLTAPLFFLNILGTGKLACGYGVGECSLYTIETTASFIDGVNPWKMVTVVAVKTGENTGRLDLFVDGVIRTTGEEGEISFDDYDATTTNIIFNSIVPYNEVWGALDDIRIYNKALTANEIVSLYQESTNNRIDYRTSDRRSR